MPAFAFATLAALIALAPLPFGSNRLWAVGLIAIVAGGLLIAWAVATLRDRDAAAVPWYRYAPALVAFVAALAWAFAQALPGLAPPHPLWQQAGAALGAMSPYAAASIDPGASLTGAMRLLAYGAVFWLCLQACRDPKRARQLLWVIVLSGTAYALYGLVLEFSGSDSILWYRKWAYEESVTATFVNRNSLATYAGMVAIATLALLVHEVEHARVESGSAVISLVDTIDAMPVRCYMLAGCLIVLGTALLLTDSRAGVASTAFGTLLFLLLHTIYRRRQGVSSAWVLAIVLVAVTALTVVSGRGVLDRMATAEDEIAGRIAVWSATRESIGERPLVGTGLGTFPYVFLKQRDEKLSPRALPFERAHNSYIENTLELGLPATLALTGALAWLGLWCFWGVLVRRRYGVFPCVALGVLGVGAVHASIDFSLQIPAVTLCLVALLGAGCAQANRAAKSSGRTNNNGVVSPSANGRTSG